MPTTWTNLVRRFATVLAWGIGVVYAVAHFGVVALITLGDLDSASKSVPRWLAWLLSTPWWVPAIILILLTAFMIWALWPRATIHPETVDEIDSTNANLDLTLTYRNDSDIPELIKRKNLYAYYSLAAYRQFIGNRDPQGLCDFTSLFIVYSDPVTTGNVKITIMNGPNRTYEVKDFSVRHTVIVFRGTLRGSTIRIETY